MRRRTDRPLTAQSLRVRMSQERERTRRQEFIALLHQERLPIPKPEHVFAADEGRRWRFDFAWPEAFVALESEGGIWQRGAHNRAKHFLSDMEKYNRAALRGWKVLRCTPEQLTDPATVTMLRRALTPPGA